MAIRNLAENIDTEANAVGEDLIREWNNIKVLLQLHHISGIREITPLYAEKYKFDLWGLFRDTMYIPEIYIYPHIIVNDYDSSASYHGDKLRFAIIDNTVLQTYHKLFVRNKIRKKDYSNLIKI